MTGRAADVPAPPPGVSSRIDAIQQRGTLRVAVLDEFPWLIKNPSAEAAPFHGPAWRLAEEYARRLGVKIETTPVTSEDKVSILVSGAVDVSIAPLLVTPEREAVADMIPYSASAHCVFGLADNPKVAAAARLDDLDQSAVTIGFIVGTPQGAWLQKRLVRAARDGVPGNLTDLATVEILAHRADVAPIDKFFFRDLQRKLPGLVSVPKDCLASEELPISIGMAIDKGQPAFLDWLRAVAASIKPDVDAEMAKTVQETVQAGP
ncbi:transporter substrate-binding domain-containing protein [Bradyrhizobium sp. B097]|uniref:substrate-binding periplasmic protein n=1 Tax=Bradyrhizobium sp. B097 TaxID=3140244 RepID=UPI0031835C8C